MDPAAFAETLAPSPIGIEDTLLATATQPVSMPAGESTMPSGDKRATKSGEPTFISGERKKAFARSTVLPRTLQGEAELAIVADQRARYVEGPLLGQGGVGQVVAADDNDICRTVAIKRMLPGRRSAAELARFIDEIRIVGQLEHPNIVPIHDVGVDEAGQYYFVMKYVEGETLESIIEKLAAGDPAAHRKYTFERRTAIFAAVLEAVQYAHARGFIHRDIKPSNIMVGPYGEVMVMDWGIAKRVSAPEPATSPTPPASATTTHSARLVGTAVGSVIGTPAYMSPEQARGETDRLDERSDIYSLCVLFHELLTLRHYLEGRSTLPEVLDGVVHLNPKHPSFASHPHQSRVPSDLGWIAMGGLAKDPAKRYASVAQMRERMHRRANGEIEVQCPTTLAKRVTYLWIGLIDAQPLVALLLTAFAASGLLGAVAGGGWALLKALR